MAQNPTRVQVLHEVSHRYGNGYTLALQYGRYCYGDGNIECGYRFIWRRPDGSLQAARGQARLPSLKLARDLMDKAKSDGWGDYDEDEVAPAG